AVLLSASVALSEVLAAARSAQDAKWAARTAEELLAAPAAAGLAAAVQAEPFGLHALGMLLPMRRSGCMP
ncbi:unnamed protein product, partial [Polarella glacialis]